MNVFLLPLDITKDIERTLSNFWWATSQSNSRLNWLSWDRMSKHKNSGGMGFRNFRDFNLAMLGKQGWRFISNPDSLVTRLYKARYFMNTDFLNSELGSNPSFVWRSIFEAKRLVADGVRWRIGSGNAVSILGQPWLPIDDNPYITTTSESLKSSTVASLMQIDKREWDQDIVKDIFNDRDQKHIFYIALSDTGEEDVIFWRHEISGIYTVKSAYKRLQQQNGGWCEEDKVSVWSMIWRVKAPPKSLNVVWRATSNCLPTLVQLRTRKVQVQTMCPVCHQDEETILHSLVTCPVAQQCWTVVRMNTNEMLFPDFSSWLLWAFNSTQLNDRAVIITLCWALWRARNDLVWNQRYSTVNKIVAAAKQYLTQWMIAQNRSSVALLQPSHEGDGASIWVKPQPNTVMVSVDAAVFEDKEAVGFGIVVRDSDGRLVQAKSIVFHWLVRPELAEAMAVKEALSWIDKMAWEEVMLVSDCLVVVQAIRSTTPMRSQFGKVIEDCRSYLRRLNKISLYHVKRSANMVAHQLARESYEYPGRTFDRFSIPFSVNQCIELDLNE